MDEAFSERRCTEHFASGDPSRAVARDLIVEAPVALEINGIGYAVMMATPVDLEDYALGFCLSEQLIGAAEELLSAQASEVGGGWMLRIVLAGDAAAPLLERARVRLSEGSCGLCGSESLEQVMRPLPPVASSLAIADSAVFRAEQALADRQPLGRRTRAAHSAAFCAPDGEILLVREDVGRHNAFDKLIGAMARAGLRPADGFALLSARCSFELVQKAVIAGFPLLATISAATSLAAGQAARYGLRLASVVRPDSFLAHRDPLEPS